MLNAFKKVSKPFFGKQCVGHLDPEVALKRRNSFGIEKTFQVCRSRVRRVQLGKRRRYQKYGCDTIYLLHKNIMNK